jgi:hypothetical protein
MSGCSYEAEAIALRRRVKQLEDDNCRYAKQLDAIDPLPVQRATEVAHLANLERWKEEALTVMAEWDLVADEFYQGTLGASIAKTTLDRVKALKAQVASAEKDRDHWRTQYQDQRDRADNLASSHGHKVAALDIALRDAAALRIDRDHWKEEAHGWREGKFTRDPKDYMQDYLRMCDAHQAQRMRILKAIDVLNGDAKT